MNSNTKQQARAALGLYLHTVYPEAPIAFVSKVSGFSDLLFSELLRMERSGEIAHMAKASLSEMQSSLTDRVCEMCNPETPPPQSSSQMLRVAAMLAAWQCGLVEAHARRYAGSDASTIMGC